MQALSIDPGGAQAGPAGHKWSADTFGMALQIIVNINSAGKTTYTGWS